MRLFIAVNFDETTKSRLIDIQRNLKEASQSGNFSNPQNLHLTVIFLGEVKNPSKIKKAIEDSITEPFELCFNKTGKFKNNLYWVGIKPEPILLRLYKKLCDNLRNEGIYLDDRKIYSPHITIGREVVLKNTPHLDFEEFTMHVKRLSLMKSERINGKLIYTEIFEKSIS